MKNSVSGLKAPFEFSNDRERLLLDLLKKATDFYEGTIGILSSIFELSEQVRRGSPEDDFYAYIVQVLIRESRCENASVFVVEENRVVLKAAAGIDLHGPSRRVSMEKGEGVAGMCALEGRPILVSEAGESPYFKEIPGTQVKIGSILCVPIKEGEMTFGVLNLSHSRPNFFDVHTLRVFELLGLLVGQMLTLVHLSTLFQRKNSDLKDLLRQKDESLRAISECYISVVDSSEDMIFIFSADDTVAFCNQRLLVVLGRTPATLGDIFDQETVEDIRRHLPGLQPGQSRDFELNISVGTVTGIIGQFFIKRLSTEQVLVVVRDITARRRMDQRAMQTEKLTSLGLLTSGIAHELNNRLTPILGFADLIDAEAMSGQDRKRLSVIINAANSAKHIVESLLKFSRNKPPEKVVFDMRDIIKRTVSLYTPTVKKRGITLHCEEHPEPLMVRADMNCIEQVLVNFINNAIDAIDDNPGSIRLTACQDNTHVHLSIEDTGPGIPEEIMTKIFDPFFTTKAKDKGTGLGLSICYGIISEHKGEISLENTGNGAVARIKIPAMTADKQEQGTQAGEEDAPCEAASVGQERRSTIMVVEDEEDLLELMVDTLSPFYEVRPFSNGQAAFDHLDEHPWELIISDLRMPVMDGMELYRTAVKAQPRLKKKFMFITGDTYDYQIKEFLETTGAAYLRKPFRIKDLRDIVQKQLYAR
ncbi:MAG TPA: ATP-binding protein [Deltaproteobacteria bacterium]|nr:ATP-binding protein [Deltaproteobacteria bacterium]